MLLAKFNSILATKSLIIIVILFFIGCKKNSPLPSSNKSYKKVTISEYFPAYPGSWWVYDNNDSIVVDTSYHKFTYVTLNGDTVKALMPRIKPNWYVKVFNFQKTEYSYVDGLRISSDTTIDGYKYICDTVLNNKTHGGSRPNFGFLLNGNGRVVSISDTIIFQGKIYTDVVVLDINYVDYLNRAWFVKGIGLVKFTWSEQRGIDDGCWWTADEGVYNLHSYNINR